MGSPNTGLLVKLVPNDGAPVRAFHNVGDVDVVVEYTGLSKFYGPVAETVTVKVGQLLPCDCKLVNASADIYGYLQEGS